MQGAGTELFKALYIACIAIGAFLFLLLLSKQHRSRPGNKILAVFMLFLQIPTLSAYCQLALKEIPFLLLAASQCLILVYGPITYLLLCTVFKPEKINRLIYLHFLPFIVIYALKFSLSPEYTVYAWFPFVGLVLLYLCINTVILVQERQQLTTLHQQYGNTAFYWFIFIVAGIGALTLYDIVIISLYLKGVYLSPAWWYSMTLALCGYLLMASAFSIWRPEIFYNIRCKKHLNNKVKTPKLQASVASELTQKIHETLQEYELFKDNELTLLKLAKAVGVSSHLLSEVLNVHMKTSFYELLNHYRLTSALDMLENKPQSLSIIDIAFSAGFNNKNTFYRVFKERTGVTPSTYLSNTQRAV